MVEIRNLSFAYEYRSKYQKTIFEDVNLHLNGNTLLVGDSGSGKTTFFKLLLGIIKPNKGKIIGNTDVALLQQNSNLQIVTGSVKSELNIGYYKKYKDYLPDEEIQKLLNDFSLHIKPDCDPKTLSLGQKKIINFLSLYILKPEYLILDEPFVGLDEKRLAVMIKYLKEYENNFIISSHDLRGSEELYDNVLNLKDSNIKKVELEYLIKNKEIIQ